MDKNVTTDQQEQDAEDILAGAPQFDGLPSIEDHMAKMGDKMEPSLSPDGESQAEDRGEPSAPIRPGEGAEKEPTSTNIEEVNILSSAIKMMNKYAQLIEKNDPTNSKAARSIISVLGELLKSEHYDVEQEEQGLG